MIKTDIEQLLEPLINSLGYELWGCEYLAHGHHALLRLYIDKQGGINIEDCELVSKQVSALLDVEDPITGNYTLEVSSPGIPRPLFYLEHYQRFIGEEIKMKLYKPVEGKRKLTATIVGVNGDKIVLKSNDERLEVPLSNIVKANLTGE